jgi:hypothetical protein
VCAFRHMQRQRRADAKRQRQRVGVQTACSVQTACRRARIQTGSGTGSEPWPCRQAYRGAALWRTGVLLYGVQLCYMALYASTPTWPCTHAPLRVRHMSSSMQRCLGPRPYIRCCTDLTTMYMYMIYIYIYIYTASVLVWTPVWTGCASGQGPSHGAAACTWRHLDGLHMAAP